MRPGYPLETLPGAGAVRPRAVCHRAVVVNRTPCSGLALSLAPFCSRRLASNYSAFARRSARSRSWSPTASRAPRSSRKTMRAEATFDEAVDALTKPVSIRYVDRPEPAD